MSSDVTLRRYTGDAYLAANPTWHEEDAPWKTGHILSILRRNDVQPAAMAEIGCGSGAVAELLASSFPAAATTGFEIAPHAFARALTRSRANLSFVNGKPDPLRDRYDVALAIDVVEHVENPHEFVREMKAISRFQVFHIPLDLNALAAARGWVITAARRDLGHIHYFTRDTALEFVEECGLRVVDSFYTPWAIDQSHKSWKKRVAALPRRVAYRLAPHAVVRAVGGWSLMVLTEAALEPVS